MVLMQSLHEVVPLDGTFDDPANARRVAARVLRRAECDEDLLRDALLCLSELVTNAVLHAGGPICVELWTTDDSIRLEVVDRMPATTPGLPELADARAALLAEGVAGELERETGRGLGIVAQLARAWGVEGAEVDGEPGKRVWVELGVTAMGHPGGAPDANTDVVAPGTEAVLVDVPIRLFLASEAHLEALLREMQPRAAAWTARDDRLMKGLANALRRNAAARATSLAEARRQIDEGHTRMTVRFPISADTPTSAQEFLDVVDLSETLTRREDLDDDGPGTELRHFRRWYVTEITRQAQGDPPRACPFRP
jgi:anti-sigma regulatory factor (Ser/Thr protein kinase)